MSNHRHKKQFGQNFLNNQAVINNIVNAINPKEDQHLVEIGPGEAALTEPLLSRVRKLDIIEIDRDLIAPLTKKLGHFEAFNLHHTDALAFDYASLLASDKASDEATTRSGCGENSDKTAKLRLVGNLPYNISSPLLFHLLEFAPIIEDMHFMLQKEVVDRITSEPGSKVYGRLSVMIQYACQAEYLFTVGPENFTPPPKVDSAILRLIPYQTPPFIAENLMDFADLVKQSFSQKRKTLRNNLKGWLNAEQIESCGIDPSIRAESLSVENFVKLANFYSQIKPSKS